MQYLFQHLSCIPALFLLFYCMLPSLPSTERHPFHFSTLSHSHFGYRKPGLERGNGATVAGYCAKLLWDLWNAPLKSLHYWTFHWCMLLVTSSVSLSAVSEEPRPLISVLKKKQKKNPLYKWSVYPRCLLGWIYTHIQHIEGRKFGWFPLLVSRINPSAKVKNRRSHSWSDQLLLE